MTQPDEPTMPDTPEKAHGDALEELVDSDAEDVTEQSETDAQQ